MLDTLPDTTDDNLMESMSTGTLCKYAMLSRNTRDKYRDYTKRAFSITVLLHRYFTDDEIVQFRLWQAKTGMLISGSTAVQFFDRTLFRKTDLDLFINEDHCLFISCWLELIGYRFLPTAGQNRGVEEVVMGMPVEPNQVSNIERSNCYRLAGIANVLTFGRRGGNKIQLIVCRGAPLQVILHFHSTCVMNIICHDRAIALFPDSAFESHISLECEKMKDFHKDARKKYQSRGWTMKSTLTPWEMTNPSSDFFVGPRAVGDKKCWTIPLPPLTDRRPSPLIANSWRLSFDFLNAAQMGFFTIKLPSGTETYLVANKELLRFVRPALRLALYHTPAPVTDKDLENLLVSYLSTSPMFF